MDHHNYNKQQLMQSYRVQREARIQQRNKRMNQKRLFFFTSLFLCIALLVLLKSSITGINPALAKDHGAENQSEEKIEHNGWIPVGQVKFKAGYTAETTPATIQLDDSNVLSAHAILINPGNNSIIAQKDAFSKISPASMTKILTILVAAEHITNLDDSVTITREITDYTFKNKCSAVGFKDEETVTVRDLFYGTILPSGADAAVALANYVAGSQEAFVELMNQKLTQLGLSDTTHFTNCVGLYDDNHYSTTYDIAIILKAALENDWCRKVLSTHSYTTSQTKEHPEGLSISNWFLRRIEDKETGGTVLSAKTGFVNQSGNCSASYAISASGKPYIAVTVNAYSSWRCIYDHAALYSLYAS